MCILFYIQKVRLFLGHTVYIIVKAQIQNTEYEIQKRWKN